MSRPTPDHTYSQRLRRTFQDAAWPIHCVAWTFQRRLVWPLQDTATRTAYAGVGLPLERLSWGVQRRLIWPLDECLAGLGWPARAVLALLLLGGVTSGTLAAERLAAPTQSAPGVPVAHRPAAVQVAAEPRPAENTPLLQGTAPSFERAEEVVATSAAATSRSDAAAGTPVPVQVGAISRQVPSAALEVARRFAEAFVLYEIGQADSEVQLTLRQTTLPALAKSLTERPPSQPAAGGAPLAKVINVVAGPRYGRTGSVSVALLRLGSTSELRLQLQRTDAGWRVQDVRG